MSDLPPYSSLVISVVRLDKGNFAGTKLPRYEALRGERPPDLETTVILPESVFRGQQGPWMGTDLAWGTHAEGTEGRAS